MSRSEAVHSEMTHDELAHSLAVHRMHESRMVFEDLPCGSAGSQRPDVLEINKSFSKPNPHAFEVKVSVSDFRSDVTSAKWRGYLNYAWGVTFAVPKGLITKNDLPDGCGLITFNGEGWSTAKRPTLSPRELDSDFLLKLLMDGKRRETKPFRPQCKEFDHYKSHEALRQKFGKDVSGKISLIDKYPQMKSDLQAHEARICELLGVKQSEWNTRYDLERAIKKIESRVCTDVHQARLVREIERLKASVTQDLDKTLQRFGVKA